MDCRIPPRPSSPCPCPPPSSCCCCSSFRRCRETRTPRSRAPAFDTRTKNRISPQPNGEKYVPIPRRDGSKVFHGIPLPPKSNKNTHAFRTSLENFKSMYSSNFPKFKLTRSSQSSRPVLPSTPHLLRAALLSDQSEAPRREWNPSRSRARSNTQSELRAKRPNFPH